MYDCPQCGSVIDDEDGKCPVCGFNFNYLLNCPYKVSNRCLHNSRECYIEGLNFELCELYLHKSGISY